MGLVKAERTQAVPLARAGGGKHFGAQVAGDLHRGHAAIARAGNTIFSLEDDSELVIVRLNRQKFDAVARYEVATNETWTQPVISGNRIFVKDVSSLTLWTIE